MKYKGSILVIDDNSEILTALRLLLGEHFQTIRTEKNPNILPSLLRKELYDLYLLDMNFSAGISTGNEGLYWMREILKADPSAVIIFITAYGDVPLAVKTVREGAFDFIEKPWDDDKLLATVERAYAARKSKQEISSLRIKQKHLRDQLDEQYTFIQGVSATMKEICRTIGKVAATDANILILGENGTGKEVIAREIHRLSSRQEEVFVPVDLGALSESLFESEMFGHIKGAFTDAKEDKAGWFEVASGGTLFLDEIGNLSLALQSKLLQVLQNRQVSRLGSTQPISIDIRLVSATNKDLFQMTEQKLFREDLLYRMNTIVIELPPLRDRKEDIPFLAAACIKSLAVKYNKPGLGIDKGGMEKLQQYFWPGNVRELNHTLEKSVILSEAPILTVNDIVLSSQYHNEPETLNLEENERRLILRAMEKNSGNISDASKSLGISRKTIYNKIKHYGL